MTVDRLIDELKQLSPQPPDGARERVWRRLKAPRAPSARPRKLALVGAVVIAAGMAALRFTPQPPHVTEGVAWVGRPGTHWTVEGPRTVSLNRGAATWTVYGEPVTVHAANHVVWAEAAVFALSAAGDQLALDLREGELLLDGERLSAPLRRGAVVADLEAVRRLEPPHAGELRAWRLAQARLARGDVSEAARMFASIGAAGGLRAEAALLKAGELELRRLGEPRAARTTFDSLARRFPQGSLRQEAQLSALEASAQLSDWQAVRERVTRFAADFPDSERIDEVRWAGARAAWELDDTAAACAQVSALDVASGGAVADALRQRCDSLNAK